MPGAPRRRRPCWRRGSLRRVIAIPGCERSAAEWSKATPQLESWRLLRSARDTRTGDAQPPLLLPRALGKSDKVVGAMSPRPGFADVQPVGSEQQRAVSAPRHLVRQTPEQHNGTWRNGSWHRIEQQEDFPLGQDRFVGLSLLLRGKTNTRSTRRTTI